MPSMARTPLLLCLAILTVGATAQPQMPYNPTRILLNDSLVYVFQPAAAGAPQFQLGSVDISSKVDATNLAYTTLYETLPFLDSTQSRPFNAILSEGGNITVYTGNCTTGASGGRIWNFIPEREGKNGNGSWAQHDTSYEKTGTYVADLGPNYLSAGVAFSTLVDSDAMSTDAYFFGGMCPFSDSNSTNWQSAANYSSLMVTLEPFQAGASSVDYQLDSSATRGAPIAEAGFSLTGLTPSVSNRSDGTLIQQQNFVLIGGHTSAAFINTSQVALFSVPQEGWTFLPVSQPDTTSTELAIRTEVTSIEPRSGHSAVLTPDGQRIVVFGGWIGDVNTPADPQLAVLNVGDGYGGKGSWQWSVPTTSGSGLPTGSGIYGHGATMLPGGVMMIMGGYSIAATSSRLRRDSNTNSQTLFFNVTSNSWITEYTAPASNDSHKSPKGGLLSSASQKAGLGAGVAIGMAAICGLIAFYIWYNRKFKRQRDEREKQLNELSMNAHRYTVGEIQPEMRTQDGDDDYFDHSNDAYFYPLAGVHNQGWKRADSHEAERTGLLVEIPSPTRGLRRGMSNRPTPQVPRYDERRTKGSGSIHPIDELDEDQEQEQTPLNVRRKMAERAAKRKGSVFDSAPALDPFTDADGHRPTEDQRNSYTLQSAPASPTRHGATELNQNNSASSRLAAAHSLHATRQPNPITTSERDGRTSPAKSSERTGSNLSERSTHSDVSSRSTNRSKTGSPGRGSTMLSAALLNNANPFKTPETSPTDVRSNAAGDWHSPAQEPRTHSMTSIRSDHSRPKTANADADSFITARSSFAALRAEGEALLGGNPLEHHGRDREQERERERERPIGTSSTVDGSNSFPSRANTDVGISRAATVTAATSLTEGLARAAFGRERRKSWLGSVRRALSRSTTSADRTRSLTATAVFEAYQDEPSSSRPGEAHSTSTNNKRRTLPASSTPRRAVSDASFWRSRRGKSDWLDEEEYMDPSDPRAKWRRTSGDDWGAPEDVALAEKERQRRAWRERGNLLISLSDDTAQLPTPHTPINPADLDLLFPEKRDRNDGVNRPCTPADEDDWDVEAAAERRVVQVMFTVPRSKLRVVNADVDGSSILSFERPKSMESVEASVPAAATSSSPTTNRASVNGSPSRVKDLAGRFEQLGSSPSSPSPSRSPGFTPRASPRPSPSPSPSIRSVKLRGPGPSRRSEIVSASTSSLALGLGDASVNAKAPRGGSGQSLAGKGKARAAE